MRGYRKGWGQNKPPQGTPLNWGDPITRGFVGYWLIGNGPSMNLARARYPGTYTGHDGTGTTRPSASIYDGASYLMTATDMLFIDDVNVQDAAYGGSQIYNFTTAGVFSVLIDLFAIVPTKTSVLASKSSGAGAEGWILQITTDQNGGSGPYGIYMELSDSGNGITGHFAAPAVYGITPGIINRICARFDGANAKYTINGLSNWTTYNGNAANGLGNTAIITPKVPTVGFGDYTTIGGFVQAGPGSAYYASEHAISRGAFIDRYLSDDEAVRLTLLDPFGLHVPRLVRGAASGVIGPNAGALGFVGGQPGVNMIFAPTMNLNFRSKFGGA